MFAFLEAQEFVAGTATLSRNKRRSSDELDSLMEEACSLLFPILLKAIAQTVRPSPGIQPDRRRPIPAEAEDGICPVAPTQTSFDSLSLSFSRRRR